MDSAILAKYEQDSTKPIPMFEMNQPVAERTVFGDIGLELEMEGTRLPTAEQVPHPAVASGAYWTTHQDGSLRGESTEYVLSTPCFENEVEALVQSLWATFRSRQTVLANSNRCSTHCHINVQGMKVSDLVSILALWAVFEKQIIRRFGGESRTTNHFCLSLRDSDENISRMSNFLRSGVNPAGRDLRYAALNITSAWSRGSFEFRCAPAADTPEIPILFGTFLKKFVEFTVQNFHNPAMLGASLSERGAIDLFKAICDTNPVLQDFYRIIVPQGEEYAFNRDGLEGFRIAQPLCHVFPWYEWMPMIDKKVIDPFGAKAKKNSRYADDGIDGYMRDLQRAVRDGPAPRRARGAGVLAGGGIQPVRFADIPIGPQPGLRMNARDGDIAIDFGDEDQPMRVPDNEREARPVARDENDINIFNNVDD